MNCKVLDAARIWQCLLAKARLIDVVGEQHVFICFAVNSLGIEAARAAFGNEIRVKNGKVMVGEFEMVIQTADILGGEDVLLVVEPLEDWPVRESGTMLWEGAGSIYGVPVTIKRIVAERGRQEPTEGQRDVLPHHCTMMIRKIFVKE